MNKKEEMPQMIARKVKIYEVTRHTMPIDNVSIYDIAEREGVETDCLFLYNMDSYLVEEIRRIYGKKYKIELSIME